MEGKSRIKKIGHQIKVSFFNANYRTSYVWVRSVQFTIILFQIDWKLDYVSCSKGCYHGSILTPIIDWITDNRTTRFLSDQICT